MTETSDHTGLDVSIIVRDEAWFDESTTIEGMCQAVTQAVFAQTRDDKDESGFNEDQTYEAAVVLADDEFVAELNQDYRGRQGPTNVLSFVALDDEDEVELPEGLPYMLGDIIIALGVVRREAAEMGIPLTNHLKHLVAHGMLHLLGYDHIEEDDAVEMEELETRILASMGIDDPYGESQ